MIFNGKIIYEWAIFHGHVKLQEDSVGFSVRSPTTAHRQTTVPGFNRLQLPRVEGNLWRNEARKKQRFFFCIGFHWKLSIYTEKMVVSYKLFCHEHPWVFHGFPIILPWKSSPGVHGRLLTERGWAGDAGDWTSKLWRMYFICII